MHKCTKPLTIKKEFGDGTRRFNLCFFCSNSGGGFNKSMSFETPFIHRDVPKRNNNVKILWQKLPTNLTWSIKQTTQLHLQPTHIRFPCQKTQPTSGNLMKRKEKTQHSFPVLTFWNQNYKFPQKLTEEKNLNTMENQTTNKTSIAKMTSNTPNLISLGDHKMR